MATVQGAKALTSAYNTIVRGKDPTVKPGENRPWNVVDPALCKALEAAGVEIDTAVEYAGNNRI